MEQVSDEESDQYFSSLPRDAQIRPIVSKQVRLVFSKTDFLDSDFCISVYVHQQLVFNLFCKFRAHRLMDERFSINSTKN